jgi:hypothetical protein
MYSARMAEPVDCFSSTPPPAHGERPPGALEEDYGLVFDGLRIATEAGATAFARAVKFDFIRQLQELDIRTVMEMPTDVEPLLPCWVQQRSVSFRVPKFHPIKSSGPGWEKFKEDYKPLLRSLSRDLVQGILHTLAMHEGADSSYKVHLVGATSTDVRTVREDIFSFFVKQKWALSRHER